MRKKILIVAAHPDDEILGCGATIAKLIKDGALGYTLILGTGVTSRFDEKSFAQQAKADGFLKKINREALKANRTIGMKKVYFQFFPDNKFDTVAFLDIVRAIEKIKNKIRPDIIFTHFRNDLNLDHRITFQSVLTATRPMQTESVKEVYSFEIPSSTEWNYPSTFTPNVFFNVEKTIGLKLKAFNAYRTEIRAFIHPRSINALKINAQQWGIRVGLKFAEAFEAVRLLR